MKRLFFIIAILSGIGLLVLPMVGSAQTISSSSFSIKNPVITNGLTKGTSVNFGLGQSLGQRVVGKASSSSFQIWSGYQYFTIPTRFTLLGSSTTTPVGSIVLQWTTPIIPSGDPITGYDIGIGTTPYSYTFEDVGAVTSFTKSGLTSGVTYYVIAKAKTTGGVPIAYSNQVTVVPAGAPTGNTGNTSSGSGGGIIGGSVDIKGLAYPHTKVVILKDGVIVATTTADPGAAFSVKIANLNPGEYVFGVYAEDSKNLKSAPISFAVTVGRGIAVSIDNVFLAPTIGVSSTSVRRGEPIGIFGTTAPSASVALHVHSTPEYTQQIAASTTGTWFKQFDTSTLQPGSHVTFSRSSLDDRVTAQSTTIGFTVGNATVPTALTKRSDLNNDGAVNVIDFSILLYYWHRTPPVSSKADIVKDGTVDIIDFSMLLYDWTG